jgi:hypothetical protein
MKKSRKRKRTKKPVSLHNSKLKIIKVMATIHGATLNASVNPNGLDTTVKFLYGTDPLLGNPVEVDLPVIPAGQEVVPVSAPITDLVAETTYFFKVSAANSAGSADGDVLDFATPADVVVTGAPVVETLAATDIV